MSASLPVRPFSAKTAFSSFASRRAAFVSRDGSRPTKSRRVMTAARRSPNVPSFSFSPRESRRRGAAPRPRTRAWANPFLPEPPPSPPETCARASGIVERQRPVRVGVVLAHGARHKRAEIALGLAGALQAQVREHPRQVVHVDAPVAVVIVQVEKDRAVKAIVACAPGRARVSGKRQLRHERHHRRRRRRWNARRLSEVWPNIVVDIVRGVMC